MADIQKETDSSATTIFSSMYAVLHKYLADYFMTIQPNPNQLKYCLCIVLVS